MTQTWIQQLGVWSTRNWQRDGFKAPSLLCRNLKIALALSLTSVVDLLEGFSLHPDWKRGEAWTGTTIDLKAAYKQMFVAESNNWASAITVYNPTTGKASLFAQTTLPFGATASVVAFNRASRALWFLGCRLLHLAWLNFFDDFPILATSSLAKSTLTAGHLFLSLLGWNISAGDKQADFASMFSALGVTFNIAEIPIKRSSVVNSLKRTKDMIALLESKLRPGVIPEKEAEVIRAWPLYTSNAADE